MKLHLSVRFGLVALLGILVLGCAPTGTTVVESVPSGGPRAASESPTPEAPRAEPAQAIRSSPVEQTTVLNPVEQTTVRAATAHESDAPAVVHAGGDPPQASENLESEWTMSLQPGGTVFILHNGVPVVKEQYITWAEKAQWVPTPFKTSSLIGGGVVLKGGIPKLDLEATGEIRPLAENQLGFEYRFNATKGHQGIRGAVLDWKFDLKSQTFSGKVAEPTLLENKTGWRWQVGPNEAITVRFDQPLDLVIYERGNKDDIRTFYYADHFESGSRQVRFTIELPEGGRVVPSVAERYGSPDTTGWYRDALSWDGSPVDLSFLNAAERPAGRHGLLKADGDQLVFEDGTSFRFWGCNVSALALFSTPRENIPRQAHRLAQLGFNLVRLMHIDASWCNPNIFEDPKKTTRRINPKSIDSLDLWMKCLKDEGIYIWLELNYERRLTATDGVSVGYDEIKRSSTGMAGFSYFNQDVRRLMLEFQHQFLNHVNRYTRQAYKDEPAVVGVLITNENDLTTHYGNLMLPDHKNPVHNAIFTKEYKEFARRTGLPEDRTWRTWEPGPSKVFLNDMEHRFNRVMIEDLRKLGVRAPLATTDAWAGPSQFSLPALTDGDIIDAHSYGEAEALSANPHYEPNFVASIGLAQVQDRPLAITEWNTPVPTVDRFTSPLYVASIASLQGWDMPMVFGYSQIALSPLAKNVDQWSIYNDPCLCGLMPAAALAFRKGHISPARNKYCMMLNRAQLFDQAINPVTSAAVRTLMEQSRLTTGFPVVKELPWLQPTQTPSDATIVTDPDHDYIPKGQPFVRSDTGELLRDWKQGIQTIDTPKTQAVAGWIGGRTLKLSDVTIRIDTRKAVVALSAIDDQPLSASRDILITAVARAVPTDTNHVPYLSEPVVGTVTLRTKATGVQLFALDSHGKVVERLEPKVTSDGVTIHIPTKRGTHWYALRTGQHSK